MRTAVSALATLVALATSSAQASFGPRMERFLQPHNHGSVQRWVADHPGLVISEAASSQTVELAHHPDPNHLASRLRQHHRASKQTSLSLTGRAATSSKEDSHTETMNTVFSGVYPLVNITWPGHGGDQVLQHYVDTGSSDTLAVEQGFKCLNTKTHKHAPAEHCRWGTPYDRSKGAFDAIPSEDFDISYFPENEHLHGEVGWSPLKIAGVSLSKTKVAMVNRSLYLGDGHSSGLLGLAYPSITNAFKSSGAHDEYDPVFVSMVKQGVVKDAIFSLAVNRVPPNSSTGVPAGTLALGGLVSQSLYDAPLTTVSIEQAVSNPGNLSFYAFSHTLSWRPASQKGQGTWKHFTNSKTGKKKYQSIVDSGTSAMFVPTHAARQINAGFQPPAKPYAKDKEYWTVNCDAKPPEVSVKFGGKHWRMDSRDMIVKQLTALPDAANTCFSGIADGGSPEDDVMILGAVWQRSVVVGYDIGRSKLHFAPRKPY